MKTSLSIRWRLTVWYIGALLFILVIFSGLMSAMMSRQMHQQVDSELTEEAKELAEEIQSMSSLDEIRSRFHRHFAEHGGFSFQISHVNGDVICGSPWLLAHQLPQPGISDDTELDWVQDLTLSTLGLHRIIVRQIHGPHEPLLIKVVVPHAQIEKQFRSFLQTLLFAGTVSLIVACIGGLMIARHALKPLEQITRAAERISAADLTIPIAVDNPSDELGRLAMTLNRTFQRLHMSINEMKRFTGDAAHELRTPLCVLRTQLEVALRSPHDIQKLRSSCQIAIDQTEDLTALIDQLLTLSRQDAGIKTTLVDEVYLHPILEDIAESLRTESEKKGVSLQLDEIPECIVIGDDIAISRLFYNLIGNAIKYTPAGGTVTVSGFQALGQVHLTVQDDGIGISSDHLPLIFDRFYRVDPARNGETGGTGLGLAICRSIVESHGGEISVSSQPGKGTRFTVMLPTISKTFESELVSEHQYA